jgi:glycosyltransferase involved in cell wall biosynthesis
MVIRQTGLFLSAWYLAANPEAGGDGVEHFCSTGWAQGARPNPYFEPAYYLAQNPEVAAAQVNPLLHYIAFGEAEGRRPSAFFDPAWYRETYGLGAKEPCLRHYLERRLTGQVNPVPVFDGAFYLDANPDVAAGGADPFEHFLVFGVAEQRDPAPDFDIAFYLNRYGAALGDQNPLLHYLANREGGAFLPKRPEHETLQGAVRRATRPSPAFEEFRPVPAGAKRRAKLLAFYLPQFHSVPENDAWWGKGFTDWTNLARAQPRFAGHLQPRVPRDLGYYSLDDPGVLARQIELALGAGISGFVFYFYWFNRRRLLDKPLEQLLGDASLAMPFCVMWANENWTRRWDGLEREVLIAQEYLPRDDAALVAEFARLFADPRYIRLGGRPLLMLYRAALIPDARNRIAAWRALFRSAHGEDPILVMAQSLGDDYDPTPYGLDGAVEFPPHKLSQALPNIRETLTLYDPDFSAKVHDYAAVAEISVAFEPPDYPLIKTIVPGWDNDPRREGAGLVLQDATPAKYQDWLEQLVDYAARHEFYGERLICVNAWNEWAEGAFLEPDLHFGAAFLNATGRAICARDVAAFEAGILLVGHDAQPHGAQLLLLHLARRLQRQWGLKVHLLLLGVGPLLGAYYEAAAVRVASDKTILGQELDRYRAMGITCAIVNSAASARIVPWAEGRGLRCTLLVHEMPLLLREYDLEIQARLGAMAASQVVCSSARVAAAFAGAIGLPELKPAILPQGNYQAIAFDAASRRAMRAELGLADADFLVLGAGFAHLRKGFDLFLQLAQRVAAERADVQFVWVGDLESGIRTYLAPEMAAVTAAGRFQHVPFTARIADYFAAADVFALTSREDPYPTVVLEALACGVPCIAFADAGGIPDLLREGDAGRVARFADLADFAVQLASLLDRDSLAEYRARLPGWAADKFDFAGYVTALLHLAQPALRGVTAAVLSYNYAQHLPARLGSVFGQTYPIRQVLVLDDASTDGSQEAASAIAEAAGRDITICRNAQNSGSPFAQWRQAAARAQSEFVWLCEADDSAEPGFLAGLVEAMAEPDILFGFTDSRAIDAAGATVMPDYQAYYAAAGAAALGRSGTWGAREFAAKFLSVRNLIPNVSAVLWRRQALRRALDAVPELESWALAGDWRLYLAALGLGGRVAYLAEPLNLHRRGAGVTQRLQPAAHLAEIARMHEILMTTLDLGRETLAAQAAYRADIAAQFGLSKPARLVRRRKV